MLQPEQLLQNYARVREEIADACHRCGRSPSDILLLAVAKLQPAEAIRVLAAAGHLDFAENYMQEALQKQEDLAGILGINWHMIGHVQSRKAALAAGNFKLIHTVDSIRLANALEKRLQTEGRKQAVLIEVNIANEPQKSGIAVAELEVLASHISLDCQHLDLRGLMCLPPVFDDGEAARPYFAALRELRDNLVQKLGLRLPELSMGMSGDFAAAIAEGATIVRIGTAIFGPRPKKQ